MDQQAQHRTTGRTQAHAQGTPMAGGGRVPASAGAVDAAFELRFHSLFIEGRGYSFPCDREGHVLLDGLSERARLNYFFARKCVGREFAVPAVQPAAVQ